MNYTANLWPVYHYLLRHLCQFTLKDVIDSRGDSLHVGVHTFDGLRKRLRVNFVELVALRFKARLGGLIVIGDFRIHVQSTSGELFLNNLLIFSGNFVEDINVDVDTTRSEE